jgi:hypothetical protein
VRLTAVPVEKVVNNLTGDIAHLFVDWHGHALPTATESG